MVTKCATDKAGWLRSFLAPELVRLPQAGSPERLRRFALVIAIELNSGQS